MFPPLASLSLYLSVPSHFCPPLTILFGPPQTFPVFCLQYVFDYFFFFCTFFSLLFQQNPPPPPPFAPILSFPFPFFSLCMTVLLLFSFFITIGRYTGDAHSSFQVLFSFFSFFYMLPARWSPPIFGRTLLGVDFFRWKAALRNSPKRVLLFWADSTVYYI